jgi:hypothetical protein
MTRPTEASKLRELELDAIIAWCTIRREGNTLGVMPMLAAAITAMTSES